MAANTPYDDSGDDRLLATSDAGDNSAPLSITEISQALKRTVEDRFGYVRLRGEPVSYTHLTLPTIYSV